VRAFFNLGLLACVVFAPATCWADAADPASFDGIPREYRAEITVLPPSNAAPGPRRSAVAERHGEPPTDRELEERWYGWQTLAVDGIWVSGLALALAGVGQDREVNGLLVGAGWVYALGAPTVHLFHGRTGTAAESLVMRVAAPAFAAPLGEKLGGGRGAAGATLLALSAAVLVDDLLLSRESVPCEPETVSFVPVLQPLSSGFELGVGGRF
jgi:hypothetical protein